LRFGLKGGGYITLLLDRLSREKEGGEVCWLERKKGKEKKTFIAAMREKGGERPPEGPKGE